ncbi:hypothetical protein LTR62_003114 [Meristemomyces frigidus]|uniref:Peptidase A1 domain-containing protein n=1 Tax=Meristemomyces frigidus TaxID=1508187 RepID=A0AAN7TSF8_9PEZI|nr:hypothetical protein LTR62_003114 [Meristemomyces frigidus]
MQKYILTSSLLVAAAYAALPQMQLTKNSAPRGRTLQRRSPLAKRGGTDGIGISEHFDVGGGGGYLATISVGTSDPPQQQQVLIDTGSGDTFVLGNDYCASFASICGGGSFDPSKSTTYITVAASPAFNISFVDGTKEYGPYVMDSMTIGGLEGDRRRVRFSAKWDSSTGGTTYPNLPEVLKDSGAINSRLYSIYLDESTDNGNVLFGGLDTSKFSGDLVTLDLVPAPGGSTIEAFGVAITAISVTNSGLTRSVFTNDSSTNGGQQVAQPALSASLIVGAAGLYLPQAYYQQIKTSAFGFLDGADTCSCDHRADDITLQVEFAASVTIVVPARNLIVPLFNSTGSPEKYGNGTAQCELMIFSDTTDSFFYVGEAILRSMYVVFDLDNAQVSVAQAIINSTAPSAIQIVAAGPNGVADAASRVQTTSPNTYSIAPLASTGVTYSYSSILTSTTSTSTTATQTPTQTHTQTPVSVSGAAISSATASAAASGRTGVANSVLTHLFGQGLMLSVLLF